MGFIADVAASTLRGRRAGQAASAQRQMSEELRRAASQLSDRLRGAPGIRPVPTVAGLESELGSIASSLLKTRGEDIFRRTGQIGEQTASRILERLYEPGSRYTDITRETTDAALENLGNYFAQRGISPRSPLVITEGRREARDVAIQNALNRLAAEERDIERGAAAGQFFTGLEETSRNFANQLLQSALSRQATGELQAAGIESGILSQLVGPQLAAAGAGAQARGVFPLALLEALSEAGGGETTTPTVVFTGGGGITPTDQTTLERILGRREGAETRGSTLAKSIFEKKGLAELLKLIATMG